MKPSKNEINQPSYILKPSEIYGIKVHDQILAGMANPIQADNSLWESLYEKGIQNVVCLLTDKPLYNPEPLKILASVRLEDLYGGVKPSDEPKEKLKIRGVVGRITKAIKSGESVVIHCEGGTGRTGTVIGCVLREIGYDFEAVLNTMTEINRLRGRSDNGWPESDWQSNIVEGW